MDIGVVGILAGILAGGFTVGMLLSVAFPRDEEAAAMHRRLARRALARLTGRFHSETAGLEPQARVAGAELGGRLC